MSLDLSSTEIQNTLNLIQHTHHSLFLTGRAGTGKSTLLRHIASHTRKKHVVLAPTGIAAINAGGQTLHSFFKLPFHPLVPDDSRYQGNRIRQFLKYSKAHIKLIRELQLIIIDEISMVRADIIDFIDRILRTYTGNLRQPFGGKQMLFVGDVYQLEPVVKGEERDILQRFYPNSYFFSAYVFRQFPLVSIELTHVFRQNDQVFIKVLDHLRNGTITQTELQLLNTRVDPMADGNSTDKERLSLVLATRRDTVDHINQSHLDELPGKPFVFIGERKGDFPDNMMPTPLELELKVGAQIIFIKNDKDHRFVNGTLGIISEIDEEGQYLGVHTEEGEDIVVERDIWENVRYTYNEQERKVEEEQLGVYLQMPVRLAWAITIHKSQGLTFDNVIVDMTGGSFAAGQTYVALSRCRTLQGMTLTTPIQASEVIVRPEVERFATTFNSQTALNQALKEAEADLQYIEAIRAYDKGELAVALDHFFLAIHTRYDIEKPLYRRYLQRKLRTSTRLVEQNRQLMQEMDEMRKRLRRYADEYYRLGNQCVTEAHDLQAALRNYDKALDLDPTHIETLVRKAITLGDLDDYNEALKTFHRATQLSPMHFKAHLNLGKLQLHHAHYEEAVESLLRATTIRQDHPRPFQLLGDAYAHLGKEDAAEVSWRIAEELREKKKAKQADNEKG